MLRGMVRESDRGWIAKNLASGGLKAIGFYIVKLALPFIVASLAVLSGYLSAVPIPWMWIIMASSVAFAGVAGGILWFDQLRERNRVKGKLNYALLRVGRNIAAPNELFLGVELASIAATAVAVELESIRTRIGTYVPYKTQRDVNTITVAPHGRG